MTNKLMLCPFCKKDEFIRTLTDVVKIEDDGECMTDLTQYDYKPTKFECLHCCRDVTEEELIREDKKNA